MAQVDYFLKIDGIEGESNDSKHKNEIDVLSFSFGAVQDGITFTGGGLGAGKVKLHDFHFTMQANKASPKLYMHCTTGTHIKKAVLTCRKAGKDQQEYLTWTFNDLLISSYQFGGDGSSGPTVHEQISFFPSEAIQEYKEQKADGTLGGAVKHGWNQKTNKMS